MRRYGDMVLFRRKQQRETRSSTTGAGIAEGWNGFAWGAPLSSFTERYPNALLTESGWWQTGEAPESFCGVPMSISQYAFNDRDELSTVAFIPEPENRARLSVAAMNELGAPDGMDLLWTFGDAVAEVKLAGVIATLTHPAYVDR